MTDCPDCDCRFSVIWNLNPVYDKPEYCPFCGAEIDYSQNSDDEE